MRQRQISHSSHLADLIQGSGLVGSFDRPRPTSASASLASRPKTASGRKQDQDARERRRKGREESKGARSTDQPLTKWRQRPKVSMDEKNAKSLTEKWHSRLRISKTRGTRFDGRRPPDTLALSSRSLSHQSPHLCRGGLPREVAPPKGTPRREKASELARDIQRRPHHIPSFSPRGATWTRARPPSRHSPGERISPRRRPPGGPPALKVSRRPGRAHRAPVRSMRSPAGPARPRVSGPRRPGRRSPLRAAAVTSSRRGPPPSAGQPPP